MGWAKSPRISYRQQAMWGALMIQALSGIAAALGAKALGG